MSFEEAKKLDDHFVMHTFARKPVLLVEGSGMEVKDDEGKTYLDFIAGIGVDSLGHCHPAVVRAIQDQAAKLIHVSNYYYIEQRGEVAKLLSDMLNVCVPKFFRAPWPVFFANSGAEANECAIKLARLYSKKMGGGGQTIITMDRSFHGRTLATLAATAQPAKQEAFQPLPGGFLHVPMNDLNALHQAVYNNLADVCAVMIEPVQGEAGVYPWDPTRSMTLRSSAARTVCFSLLTRFSRASSAAVNSPSPSRILALHPTSSPWPRASLLASPWALALLVSRLPKHSSQATMVPPSAAATWLWPLLTQRSQRFRAAITTTA